MAFTFNAGQVAGMHIGTVSSIDDLNDKLELSGASEEKKKSLRNAYKAAEMKSKGKTEEKRAGFAKTLFDMVKGN